MRSSHNTMKSSPAYYNLINPVQSNEDRVWSKINKIIKKIHRIIRGCYEQLYANKLDSLEERDNFLDIYHLPRLNQEQTGTLNRSITSKDIESVIKSLPIRKIAGPDGFISKFFYQILKN